MKFGKTILSLILSSSFINSLSPINVITKYNVGNEEVSIEVEDIDDKEENSLGNSNNIISIEDNMTSSSSDISETTNLKKVKVYINPSVQKNNMYVNSLGNEADNMKKIALKIKEKLIDKENIELKVNDRELSLKESCIESNIFNSDIHLALHSNAGGGKGTEIYYLNDKNFSEAIYTNYLSLNSFPKRGIKKSSSLYELNNVKAKYASLFELQFHDNEEEARWIVNNNDLIAENIAQSILEYSKKIKK